ncbi:MAG: putative thiamine pyrophosphate-containing protein YdaP [Firmicutes bacterium ADurb.Bin456]|nr:MAG: putative thiamine pyrophosphate-containing protein YdaP [Firmicutes bacterium ADurb.Bin456]
MLKQRNVAETILEQLSAWGVKNVYGLVGDQIFYLMDALAREDALKFYQVKHEESAALMASAQAKLTGETGVCLVDGGPGTVHLLNGLADAFMDNVPVLAITGQVSLKDIGTNEKQYVDLQSLLRPLVSYTSLLCDPASAPQVLENAWRPSLTGRSVSHVSVPMDVLSRPCGASIVPPAPYLGSRPLSPAEVVEGALEIIRKARRPVILSGAGGRKAGVVLGELSLRWGAAVVSTLAGMGVVDRNHPYYVGGLGQAGSPASSLLLNQADLCLAVGANWWPQNYVPKNIPVVQIDINPGHIGSTIPVAYGLVGDAGTLVEQLSSAITPDSNREWTGIVRKEINIWLKQLEQEAAIDSSPVHPAALIRGIQQTVPDDAIICLDTGDHTVWFGRVFRPVRQRILLSGKWRTMGFGLPAALAAKINRPAQRVLALVGDGGFAMTMADFLTAVKYNLKVTIVVMNNGSLALEKNKMAAGGLLPEGTSLQNPDFAGYAQDCGGMGLRVEHSGDLESALKEALGSDRPSLVDVRTADFAVPGTTFPA